MKIPKQFYIKGKRWTVSYRKLDETCDGLCEFETRRIFLKRGLSDSAKPGVFLHEMVHACLYEGHLNHDTGLSHTAEEIACDAIADMILTCFNIRWKRGKGT